MADRIRIAVLGASGYTGADLVRLALGHPLVEIAALAAGTRAGQTMQEIWPHFAPYALPPVVAADAIDWGAIDVVFGCLPHGASAELLGSIEGPRIVDLSADFRLRDAAEYADWYGLPHPAPHLLEGAVYGLTEFARDALAQARLVACPGCYPTAALLALIPLVRAGLIDPERISINALSGVTGAGRAAKEAHLFSEIGESVTPYSVSRHRHMPEIEQELSIAAGRPARISFTPHLVPMARGELLTIAVEAPDGVPALRKALTEAYSDAHFIHMLPELHLPSTRMVRGSNHAVLNVFPDRLPGRALVIAAIDNLVKGSSGQAVQNMNIMFGLPEATGLEAAPLFP